MRTREQRAQVARKEYRQEIYEETDKIQAGNPTISLNELIEKVREKTGTCGYNVVANRYIYNRRRIDKNRVPPSTF